MTTTTQNILTAGSTHAAKKAVAAGAFLFVGLASAFGHIDTMRNE